jgi:Fe-S-cluster containining protein
MLVRYEKFLAEFDKKLDEYFLSQKEHVRCKPGCTGCCELGEYPFSRLEAEYIMSGFVKLGADTQAKIKTNIEILRTRHFEGGTTEESLCPQNDVKEYRCPFLLDKMCALYDHRGIVCRTHGLAYLCDGTIKLPECAREGLNYSDVFNAETNEVSLQNPITESLRTDVILKSRLAKELRLEAGMIRPLIDWLIT